MKKNKANASVAVSSSPPSAKMDDAFWAAVKARSVRMSRFWRWPSVAVLSGLVTYFAMPFVEPRPAMIVATVFSFVANGFLKKKVRSSLKRFLRAKGVSEDEVVLISNGDANAQNALESLEVFMSVLTTVSSKKKAKRLLRAWSSLRKLNRCAVEVVFLSLIATVSAWVWSDAAWWDAVLVFVTATSVLGFLPAVFVNIVFYVVGTTSFDDAELDVDRPWRKIKSLLDGDYFRAEKIILEMLENIPQKKTQPEQLGEGDEECLSVFQEIRSDRVK